ncbi:HlyD family type I secretion periplasmic adaptor subunit [Rhizobium sp. KAs_5_22]|uniref:HlyD family type I secretion periplasmic adaptor subunit n=1 Tax=Ciceribacter selenitireducens TaxID=448181 RepID=UPI00048C2653|nr:HlyD family type I secretion periplasmic adaptor subunit [Ciceribacter selenitireducens]PPJ49102.1 HlyD family type I secretion periplasmic adaptor subunit [Rhizobium sp. KAs_5_22]
MSPPIRKRLHTSVNRHLLASGLATALFLGAAGTWAMTSSLSGAVIASGILMVEGNVKAVQHPTGSVVAELRVLEGQAVEAGQVLVRLDNTVTKANLTSASDTLDQLHARRARLSAELDGSAEVAVPQALVDRLALPAREAIMVAERRLFADRRLERLGQKERPDGQASQLLEQVSGLVIQMQTKQDEIALIAIEQAAQEKLFAQNLTTLAQVNMLRREAVRLNGEFGQLKAQVASTRGRIEEIGVQKIQIDSALRSEVSTELRDLEARQGELRSQEVGLGDALQRIDLRAPVSGLVHKLAIHTTGGVILPAETLMEIVPRDAELIIEARVLPDDIDQLSIGQPATIRFSAFNRNTTPEFSGLVVRVSADLEADERSGMPFYRAGIALDRPQVLGGLKLQPGMPAEAYVLTGERSVVSWLLKPIADHAARAMRSE